MFQKTKTISAALAAVGIITSCINASAIGAVVSGDNLNVRKSAGVSAPTIGMLQVGKKVEVLSTENDWHKISYNGDIAFVNSAYITIVPDLIVTEEDTIYTPSGASILAYAKSFIGTPYVYGGSSPSGFDCSGFVKYVYANFGIALPRTTYGQINCGRAVSTSDLQIGDLLFFRGCSHVGIYAGNNTYIHAPQTGRTVSVDPLTRTVEAARRLV